MLTLIKCMKDGMGNISYVPRWMLIFDMILMAILLVIVEIIT